MTDKKTRLIKVERVDDIPILLYHLQAMQVATCLDRFYPTHGHWAGALTLGEVVLVWLVFILSEGDHCLDHVRPWVVAHLDTLSAGLGKPIRPEDFTDDRLADILAALSDAEVWNPCELALASGLLRVYRLDGRQVRVDSTTGKTYAGVTPDGLFQFGHSKDHRPDLPQVKVNMSVLDPLGLPLTTTVVEGACADDPLYVPEIQRVQQLLGTGGNTHIGDSKMGALATRAYVAHTQDYYLCPLGGVQLPEDERAALIEPTLTGQQKLTPVYHPDTVRRKKPVLMAEGYAITVPLQADVAGQPVQWTERRWVVRSVVYAEQQAKQLDKRLQQAVDAIEQLNVRKQGKKRLAADALPAAAQTILQRQGVEGLIQVQVQTTQKKIKKRRYGAHPARVRQQSHPTVRARLQTQAVAAVKQRMGWRVYATNQLALTVSRVVLAYRGQYTIERGFGRLKGRALSLTPLYLHIDSHVIGLIRLLTIALRGLTLVEFVVRRQVAEEGNPVKGLYAGNPQRATARPTAETILRAFRGISLVVERVNGQQTRRLTPLSPLQTRLLRLLGASAKIYLQLIKHFQKPAPF